MSKENKWAKDPYTLRGSEARALIAEARKHPEDLKKKSRVNRIFTREQMIEILEKSIEQIGDDFPVYYITTRLLVRELAEHARDAGIPAHKAEFLMSRRG